jgi:PTS system ascorbate-specific IIB component
MSDKPKPITVIAVCGCGMGSSVILRMNMEKVFNQLGIPAKIEVADATTGKGAARGKDLIIVSVEFQKLFKDYTQPVIILNNFVDKKELFDKISAYMKKIGRLK